MLLQDGNEHLYNNNNNNNSSSFSSRGDCGVVGERNYVAKYDKTIL